MSTKTTLRLVLDEEPDLYAEFAKPAKPETAKERHERLAPSQAESILAYLIAHVGVAFSKLEIRAATGVENVDGRIGDLQRQGWHILGADALSMAQDGTQLYQLVSTERRPARRKGYGYTVRADSYDGARVVMEKNHDGLYTDEELALLGRLLEATVTHWESRVGRRN